MLPCRVQHTLSAREVVLATSSDGLMAHTCAAGLLSRGRGAQVRGTPAPGHGELTRGNQTHSDNEALGENAGWPPSWSFLLVVHAGNE